MVCECGRLYPAATTRSKGLCVECGRSIWLQAARKSYPDCAQNARILNERRALSCLCPRTRYFAGYPMDTPFVMEKTGLFGVWQTSRPITYCVSKCGVRLVEPVSPFMRILGPWWVPFEPREREEWFNRILRPRLENRNTPSSRKVA